MRVFMLGWEFPPFIAGGLGTACYGLTKALSRRQVNVTFVLPKAIGHEYASHVRVLSPQSPAAAMGSRAPEAVASSYELAGSGRSDGAGPAPEDAAGPSLDRVDEAFSHVTFKAVPSRMPSVYATPEAPRGISRRSVLHPGPMGAPELPSSPAPGSDPAGSTPSGREAMPFTVASNYQGDLVAEAQRYADLCVDLAAGGDFDVIHAHDWLTFPAGLAVAARTGKPLVVHVHSTEFDRSGDRIHEQVYDIERRGMHGAIRVIAVSHLTKSILQYRYGVESSKIHVVYNGIENGQPVSAPRADKIRRGDKIVLFLGRITMQKGPEYFIGAAKKVLEKYERVKFVMAGSGDMIREIIELAAAEGIGQKVLFTGFLSSKDVERVMKMADVYVMPSVSEPFGIAPLEAISHDVPVIISKTSGVSEVLTHALKVDFWDTHEMANKIIAVLKHPPLSATLREHADMEVRKLTWDDAAAACVETYQSAMTVMPR